MSGMQEDNHIIIYPFNTDANIYTKIIKFGALHKPTIIDMIGMLITTHEDEPAAGGIPRVPYMFLTATAIPGVRKDEARMFKAGARQVGALGAPPALRRAGAVPAMPPTSPSPTRLPSSAPELAEVRARPSLAPQAAPPALAGRVVLPAAPVLSPAHEALWLPAREPELAALQARLGPGGPPPAPPGWKVGRNQTFAGPLCLQAAVAGIGPVAGEVWTEDVNMVCRDFLSILANHFSCRCSLVC
jgi:hypothetical protein